jgi:hypothetical protein
MTRGTLAVVAGLVVWAIIATGLDMVLRIALIGYRAAEPQLQFTLGMMIARLALPGAIPSVAAGFVSAWVGRGNRFVIPVLIIILLAVFLPAHYHLWLKFPLWYHLIFLGSLIALPLLGAKLRVLATKG